MTNTFFDFITDPSLFQNSQQTVFSHPDYNPYSDDVETIENLFLEKKFQQVIDYKNINIYLSASAHLYRYLSLTELKDEEGAKAEMILFTQILEGLATTGDGSRDNPIRVTRISDEKDFILYKQERMVNQRLVYDAGKVLDVIGTEGGTDYYFDITVPYKQMQKLMDSGSLKMSVLSEPEKKKWWQFWK